MAGATCALIRAGDKTGLEIKAADGTRSYIAWLTANGVLEIEPRQVAGFQLEQCRLRYGLLPSFIGSDLCYAAQKMTGSDQVCLPSTQWLVGLRDGNNSMLVAVWKSDAQTASLGLSGHGTDRLFDRVDIGTEKFGFALSFVEHANLWRAVPLNEDWLGEYVPLDWTEPFPARWMAQFHVTSGGKPSFRAPSMDYSFPVARTKTRMWGVWFEDWNHYPFFFENTRCLAHFEKTFSPKVRRSFIFWSPPRLQWFRPLRS